MNYLELSQYTKNFLNKIKNIKYLDTKETIFDYLKKTPYNKNAIEFISKNKLLNDFFFLNIDKESILKSESNGFRITIFGNIGGEESFIFATEIFEKYKNIFKKNHFSIFNISQGDNMIQFSCKDKNLIKFFQFEQGLHCVKRIPVTEKKGRIHTSFIRISVISLELFKKVQKINLNPKDLNYNLFKASGKGGQHRNKKLSAVLLTHIPTGIKVVSKSERCQLKNRKVALELLREKIQLFKIEELNKQRNKFFDDKNFKDKIKTYNFKTNLFIDHRLKLDKNLSILRKLDDLNPTANLKKFFSESFFTIIKNNNLVIYRKNLYNFLFRN